MMMLREHGDTHDRERCNRTILPHKHDLCPPNPTLYVGNITRLQDAISELAEILDPARPA